MWRWYASQDYQAWYLGDCLVMAVCTWANSARRWMLIDCSLLKTTVFVDVMRWRSESRRELMQKVGCREQVDGGNAYR
jgi:hypothetical protein